MDLEKKLLTINHIDMDTQQVIGVSFYLSAIAEQRESHGLSYLSLRRRYEQLGETMGFDKSLTIYSLKQYNVLRGIIRK